MIHIAEKADIPELINLGKIFAEELKQTVEEEVLAKVISLYIDNEESLFLVLKDPSGKIYGDFVGVLEVSSLGFINHKYAKMLSWFIIPTERTKHPKELLAMLNFFEQWAKGNKASHIKVHYNIGLEKGLFNLFSKKGYSPITVELMKGVS